VAGHQAHQRRHETAVHPESRNQEAMTYDPGPMTQQESRRLVQSSHELANGLEILGVVPGHDRGVISLRKPK